MKPMKLGTVLPTKADIALTDRWHRESMEKHVAKADIDLADCDKRNVGGEVRYYLTPTVYCSVNVYGNRRWFETRSDGDYSISRPTTP